MEQAIITKCPKCGSQEIEQDCNFCPSCANDLRPLQTTLPCCGFTTLVMCDDFNFCTQCGAKVPADL